MYENTRPNKPSRKGIATDKAKMVNIFFSITAPAIIIVFIICECNVFWVLIK